MTVDREIISYVLSGFDMGPTTMLTSIFDTLCEITSNENLDAEFILVVAYSDTSLQDALKVHSRNYPVQLVVVGERNTWDQEMFAGLSRANGDYTLVLGDSVEEMRVLLPTMLDLVKVKKSDVVGIRNNAATWSKIVHWRTEVLYSLLRNRTRAPLSTRNRRELLITRKALNWILRDLSSAQCMIEMYLIPGLKFEFVAAHSAQSGYKLSRSMSSRLLTRYTRVPLKILKGCFFVTSLVLAATSLNAVSVRLRGLNLLNGVETQIPGWTTLVLLLSFGFAVMIYALYIILRTILHLAEEFSTKPNHVIKSVQRP